jgi:predicted lipid-binding transport protein (Tim44 family)
MIPPDLWTEWERRLDDFDRKGWHNRVEVLRVGPVEYVGMTNREDDAEDRCVVRIEAQVRDYVEDSDGRHIKRTDSSSETASVCQYWTLGKIGDTDKWRLVSIEERAEGDHHLADAIVASPWGDDAGRHDEAVVEGATAEAPTGVKTAEIADLDFDGDARAAANDLSLADPRFEPAVLEAAARRAVAAWAEAVDGEDAGLAAVSTPQALEALLHPSGDKTRLVVRGPQVRRLAIVALDAADEPATMTVEVQMTGRRYVEDRDTTTVVSGSRDAETTFTERWKLALDGADDTPWRIVDAAAAARGAAAG